MKLRTLAVAVLLIVLCGAIVLLLLGGKPFGGNDQGTPPLPTPTPAPGELALKFRIGGCGERTIGEYGGTRGPRDRVDLEVTGANLKMTHHLRYVCCAQVVPVIESVEVQGQWTVIRVLERNEGEMCRCICDYEVEMTLGPLEPGNYLIRLFGVEFRDVRPELLWEGEVTIGNGIGKPACAGFCGFSTMGSCSEDADCMTGGCSGQVCQSVREEPVITTCEWRDCYRAEEFGVACACLDGRCRWRCVA